MALCAFNRFATMSCYRDHDDVLDVIEINLEKTGFSYIDPDRLSRVSANFLPSASARD